MLVAQSALNKRGVAVLVVPGDIPAMEMEDGPAYAVHVPTPVTRPADAELDGRCFARRNGTERDPAMEQLGDAFVPAQVDAVAAVLHMA